MNGKIPYAIVKRPYGYGDVFVELTMVCGYCFQPISRWKDDRCPRCGQEIDWTYNDDPMFFTTDDEEW